VWSIHRTGTGVKLQPDTYGELASQDRDRCGANLAGQVQVWSTPQGPGTGVEQDPQDKYMCETRLPGQAKCETSLIGQAQMWSKSHRTESGVKQVS
jgi:hypothetical protein